MRIVHDEQLPNQLATSVFDQKNEDLRGFCCPFLWSTPVRGVDQETWTRLDRYPIRCRFSDTQDEVGSGVGG